MIYVPTENIPRPWVRSVNGSEEAVYGFRSVLMLISSFFLDVNKDGQLTWKDFNMAREVRLEKLIIYLHITLRFRKRYELLTHGPGENHRTVAKFWNVFRRTHDVTGHGRIPLRKASDAELWCFLWSAPKQPI